MIFGCKSALNIFSGFFLSLKGLENSGAKLRYYWRKINLWNWTVSGEAHNKGILLHFERNYFTGVNRLTPQTELLHTSKNEVKVIPSLPAQS